MVIEGEDGPRPRRAFSRALGRTALRIGGWWSIGCVFSLALATIRAFAPDQSVPYMRPIDIEFDIRWVARTMPDEVAERFTGEGVSWRINGTRLVTGRFGEETTALELWTRRDGRTLRTPEHSVAIDRLRRGAPFACVEGSHWAWTDEAGAARRTDRTLVRFARSSGGDLLVPYGVLWFGLLANGMMYGVGLWLLARAPVVAERAWRRRGGRCPDCGQDLGDLRPESRVCPECGAPTR
jgi:hypothetical protein